MEEDLELDSDYELYMSSLKPGYDDHVIGESSSVEYISSLGGGVIEEKEERSFKNVERRRDFKSDSQRVKAKFTGTSDGFLRKANTRMPKTVKKCSKIRVEGSENKERNAASGKRKSLIYGNKVSGEPFKKMESGKDIESFSYESDNTSVHQTDDEGGSDLEILAFDDDTFHEGQDTPFVSSKCYRSLVDEDSWDGNRTSAQSQFREKLMDLLKLPYDQHEFESLLQQVTHKRPVQGVRELRRGISKLYSTNTDGKSYLDWYKEYCP
ncbi:uncharacterized protein LOC120218566 isoform X2 [Hibiscus syriacus]|uniref:uncharacterized protein LOC120218566 isoform X2 n=1 Tax=Hibiscus syriacus TaxID=106335 RepID=UPI00192211D2|nr:uncharacterized protein LOC120218566 isoform X2 [Hibiscus syriacus]